MRITIVIITVFFTFTWSGMSFGSDQTILTVGGTGSGLGFMRLLGRSYSALHPDVKVKVLPSLGSGGGIRAIKTGAIDLAVASRPLTENEKTGLQYSFLGSSPFVFAVHPATPVEGITLSEIVNIYSGVITTWPDESHIRRFLRPSNDTDWQIMNTISPELASALQIAQKNEGIHLAITDSDAVDYLERVRGSFGPLTLTMIFAEQRKVKILAFNGNKPGVGGNDPEKYPLMKPYYLITRNDAMPALVNFIEFIHSAQGQKILTQAAIVKSGTDLK
jgi:phosphate transport system substrate-binding protein